MIGIKRLELYAKAALAVSTLALLPLDGWAGPDPVPVSAEQAFNAVVRGVDPVSGTEYGEGKVVLVDVRTRPEYQFQGTAGRVEHIRLFGSEVPVVPDLGRAILTQGGRALRFTVGGAVREVSVNDVQELLTASISVNIPCASWNPDTTQMDPQPESFADGIETLADAGVRVLITLCNSGGRSTACVVKFIPDALASRFKAIYEIDQSGKEFVHPEHGVHLAGLGGFQGSAYRGAYSGYAGFPGRETETQGLMGWTSGAPSGPSVSWKDSGLPVHIPETSCNLPDMPPTP